MSGGRREEVIPSAARLMNSMRDVGYDFATAIADLVDNSVTAGATRVDIVIRPEGAHSWVRIVDDGRGMDAAQITEAMRLGSTGREYTGGDLGKFGLGLKTASLSQARCLSVSSRTSAQRCEIETRRLDLDEVIASDRWEIEEPSAGDLPAALDGTLQQGPGTVVVWTKLDRVLPGADPFSTLAPRRLLNLAERLDTHLAMVFARFLTGSARRAEPLTITVNTKVVEPWDPFCAGQSVEVWPVEDLEVAGSVVRYRPHVLPAQREFTSEETWKAARGPRSWNHQQGLYVYRADRMIQSGGWSGLRTRDEHTKLARAALEFWPDLDDAFEIDIAKMRTRLPEALKEQLDRQVPLLCSAANARYRRSSRPTTPATPPARRAAPPAPQAVPRPSPGAPETAGTVPSTGPTGPWDAGTATSGGPWVPPAPGPATPQATLCAVSPPQTRRAALYRAAVQAGCEQALESIAFYLMADDPEVARDLGW